MKKRFFIYLVMLIAISLFGGIFTACDEEPVIPEKTEYKVTFIFENETYYETETLNGKVSAPEDPAISEGYSFGWYKERRGVNEFDFDELITSDIFVYGIKEPIVYLIEYELDGGENDPDNKTEYTVEDIVLLKPANKDGFAFLGWYKDDVKIEKITKGSVGNIVLTAEWLIDAYSITYENLKDAENSNPDYYNAESETIILQDIEAEGYDFIGWYDGDDKVESIVSGSTGNRTLTARWEIINYDITYIYNDGEEAENPVSYNIESEDITLLPSSKDYYEFVAWKDEFGRSVSVISNGTTGNKTLYAEFLPVSYDIIYANMEGAINSSKNPATYNIETEVVFAGAYKQNYEFMGWFIGEEKTEKIEAGSVGEITVTAKWQAEEFDITYDLQGGENDPDNPVKYTVEDEIILKTPEKEYFSFVGWYKGNEKIEKIEKGTSGDFALRAEWLPLVYSITYENLKGATHDNPTEFSEITLSIVFKNPTNIANYSFEGWYINGNKVEEIQKSAYHDDIVVNANWTPVQFSITYDLNGGTDTTTNPKTYNVEDEVVFQKPYKPYYTFLGWYWYGTKVEEIALGSSGDLALVAEWTPTVYDIMYNLGGGVNNEDNPYTYTVESETITFAAPTRDYYKFSYWTIGGEQVTEIASGSHGSMLVTAVWTPRAYNIAYENIGNASNPNSSVYNIESEFDLLDVSLPEREFIGWYLNGEKIERIEAGVHGGDIVLRAEWNYIEHDVTYMYNDEVVTVAETVLHRAQKIADSITPEEGYCFAWFTDDTLETQWNFNDELLEDTVLYGGVLRSYTITYNVGDGRNNENNPTSYTEKEKVVIYALPDWTSAGFNGQYVFERWESVPAGATFDTYTRELIIPKGTTGGIVLTAVWAEYTYPVQ